MVMIMSCLMLLAGCFHDDLSWKDLLDEQGNRLSEQERALQEQQAKLEAEQRRLEELAGKYDGLKKSDTPFMLVMATNPADTITKGVDFTSLFRVNPSGVAVTKDMIALDCIASRQFFRVDPATKASYVKKSDHFSLKDLELDKNATGESLDGQYLATLTSASEAAVWDESRMAFVGAYVDKEAKPQYISSEAFNTVMMPLPAEGLDSWTYPHASFKVKMIKREGETTTEEDTLGLVYVPLDGLTFKTKDDSDMRFYSAANLSEVTFLPDEGCTAAVHIDFNQEKHYVSFAPDTANNETWRQFQDSTGIKRQDVSGTMVLRDRWGGSSTLHLVMSWYNTTEFELFYEVSAEDIRKGFPVDFTAEVAKLGLVYGDFDACRRLFPLPVHMVKEGLEFMPDGYTDEKGVLTLYDTPVPGQTYRTQEIRDVRVGVSDIDAKDLPVSVRFSFNINVTIKAVN